MICQSYCSHGGRCTLDPGHEGDHDALYCTWTDDEALTRTEADEVLEGKPGGREYLGGLGLMETLFDEEYDNG